MNCKTHALYRRGNPFPLIALSISDTAFKHRRLHLLQRKRFLASFGSSDLASWGCSSWRAARDWSTRRHGGEDRSRRSR